MPMEKNIHTAGASSTTVATNRHQRLSVTVSPAHLDP